MGHPHRFVVSARALTAYSGGRFKPYFGLSGLDDPNATNLHRKSGVA